MDLPISYITLEQILLIHEEQIDLYGGSHGIADLALLESALFRPQTTFGGKDLYPTVFDKAAALIHSLILNHPFTDGNKRTGIFTMLMFMAINGREVTLTNEEIVNVPLNIASKKWNIEKIAEWLQTKSAKI